MRSHRGRAKTIGALHIGQLRLTGLRPAICWALAVIALVGALARIESEDAVASLARGEDDSSALATATRVAELAEIASLQTQVAALQTQVAGLSATPTPTVEPTPVPPAPSGQAVAHAGDWIVVVGGATPRTSVEESTARGVFIELPLTITNNGAGVRSFPFFDLVLTDPQGRGFAIDPTATTRLNPRWGLSIDPGLPVDPRLVFDVADDAGQSFVLESKVDPMFRVAVVLQPRG